MLSYLIKLWNCFFLNFLTILYIAFFRPIDLIVAFSFNALLFYFISRFKANLPAKSESNDGSSASSTSGVASQTETPTQPPPISQHQHQQFLGDASTAIPNFIEIDTCNFPLPDGINLEHVEAFKLLYREHCEVYFLFNYILCKTCRFQDK